MPEPTIEPTIEQRKYQVQKLFRLGYGAYKDGLPIPENRIEAMGWRCAKKQDLDYKATLEEAVEAFAEVPWRRDLGWVE